MGTLGSCRVRVHRAWRRHLAAPPAPTPAAHRRHRAHAPSPAALFAAVVLALAAAAAAQKKGDTLRGYTFTSDVTRAWPGAAAGGSGSRWQQLAAGRSRPAPACRLE